MYMFPVAAFFTRVGRRAWAALCPMAGLGGPDALRAVPVFPHPPPPEDGFLPGFALELISGHLHAPGSLGGGRLPEVACASRAHRSWTALPTMSWRIQWIQPQGVEAGIPAVGLEAFRRDEALGRPWSWWAIRPCHGKWLTSWCRGRGTEEAPNIQQREEVCTRCLCPVSWADHGAYVLVRHRGWTFMAGVPADWSAVIPAVTVAVPDQF